MSKHWVLKIIVLQLFRPFPGEMLKNKPRTKQSTEKLWACEPKAKWVAEYQAGNEAERQAGDFWSWEARGFGSHLPQCSPKHIVKAALSPHGALNGATKAPLLACDNSP